jgi:hypothetical protein
MLVPNNHFQPTYFPVLRAVKSSAEVRRSGVTMSRRVVLTLSLIIASVAIAAEPFRQNSIALLQPMTMMEQRVEVKEFSAYISALKAKAERFAETLQDKEPRHGFIVFAMRPDMSVKVWLDIKPALSHVEALALVAQLESVPPCSVREGTVVAAINVSFWATGKAPSMLMPLPQEWLAAMKKGGSLEVTHLVDSIWQPKDGT